MGRGVGLASCGLPAAAVREKKCSREEEEEEREKKKKRKEKKREKEKNMEIFSNLKIFREKNKR
jgi:ribosomal protein L12E/L44/L45/RPP1/RPP2